MDSEVKYTLPKPGEGTYIVAYINSQSLDAPSFHELVSTTLSRNIGEFSICHDNYNRPNGYVFIRIYEHLPVSKHEVDRFRASTFNGSPITARVFNNEDEFKEYLELYALSILKKIPLVPPPPQNQLDSQKKKIRPYYHHIFLSNLPEDKFQVKSIIADQVQIHKAKFFTVSGKEYADFYFLKLDDARNIYSLYKENKIKLGEVKMYSFCGTVESKFLMIRNVIDAASPLQQLECFGNILNKQYIPSTKQLIIEMEKISIAGRAACILRNEFHLSISTIHKGYYEQLQKKYPTKDENKKIE
ncbi:hypothetical protein M9Y10_039949 [Tritrichomonas musculus]|uniref:RRM domain-containing protein n=1 Tax=Tritrichomonas musculus TaxID=1915356 RepID=A0ABR2GR41_9EUKA